MRITELQLRHFIRETLLTEIGGSDYADDRVMRAMMDPEARRGLGRLALAAGEAALDFGKSLGQLAAETFIYFKTGQYFFDAVKGLTDYDITPESQKEWRSAIAAASLHDFLDKFGTAGLDAADIANGFLYLLEGEKTTAALCLVAAIPVVGGAIAKAKGAGKFAIKSTEIAALDAGIADIKQGLKASGVAGAEDVISEVEKIRESMNGGKANFEPYEDAVAERGAAAAEAVRDRAKLKRAYDAVNAVKVDQPVVVKTGRADDRVKRQAASWFESHKSLMDTPEAIFKAKKFTKDAETLFSKFGSDVNVKPIVGAQSFIKSVSGLFEKIGHNFNARVAITSAEDAAFVIDDINQHVEAAAKISKEGIGADTITIMPIANAAGRDTLPSAWMVSHALFDGGMGNFLVKEMPKTKKIVQDVEAVFERLNSRFPETGENIKNVTDVPLNDYLNPARALGLTVNSKWGRTSREILRQYQEGADIHAMISPTVGKELKRGEKLPDLTYSSSGKIQTQAGFNAGNYAIRPQIDNISEILSSALTKSEGYVPDFSHIPDDYPAEYREALVEAADEIENLTSGLKQAFNDDARGKVIWIAVN